MPITMIETNYFKLPLVQDPAMRRPNTSQLPNPSQ
jgi:hypothetical protein